MRAEGFFMSEIIEISLPPEWAFDEGQIRQAVESAYGGAQDIPFRLVKRSLDARRGVQYVLKVEVFDHEEEIPKPDVPKYTDVTTKPVVHIIGAGPAGLFAGLKCIESGLKPVIFERGKDVRSRRRDIARITKEHVVNPESNYCFGEGGAGAYSDGKLYTRSKKRGNVQSVLETLVAHGASADILVNAHPHIGTNKLPEIITAMRQTIEQSGGEVIFDSRMTDIVVENDCLKSIQINGEQEVPVQDLILATGHSANDVFRLLHDRSIEIEYQSFALGVRVEHPQTLIDSVQYSKAERGEHLPPASYNLVCQVGKSGVYSFCMCPGGIIAPCATNQEELVTNGWSPSKRNNPYANSGIVVQVNDADLIDFEQYGAFKGLEFRSMIERRAWEAGGKTQVAPAQRLVDFVEGKVSTDLPHNSYHPGTSSQDLSQVLPKRIHHVLQQGFKEFGSKMKGYLTNEAIVVATESRTSSPIRIPRDRESLSHIRVSGLYPCGEGAGFAGGIVSAAIDGQRCVEQIALKRAV